MPPWNPFRYVEAFKEGVKARHELNQKKEEQAVIANPGFKLGAGREATYRYFRESLREEYNNIVSPEDALAEIECLNQGRLSHDDLRELHRVSPDYAVRRFAQIEPDVLAAIYLAYKRYLVLRREAHD